MELIKKTIALTLSLTTFTALSAPVVLARDWEREWNSPPRPSGCYRYYRSGHNSHRGHYSSHHGRNQLGSFILGAVIGHIITNQHHHSKQQSQQPCYPDAEPTQK